MTDYTGAAHSMHWMKDRTASPDIGSDAFAQEMEALYEAQAEPLLRFSINATADLDFARESIQEVFLRYAELRQFEVAPPAPFVWLFRELRSIIARRSRERERSAVGRLFRYSYADPSPSPEALAQVSEARRLMDRLAAPRELECFLLRSEGLSYDEIACVMGISIGTVGATLARAMRKLERALDSKERKSR